MSGPDESGAAVSGGGPAGQDLVDFLRARYDEIEAAAREAGSRPGGPAWDDGTRHTAVARHINRHDPAAALRDIAGKRKIVAMAAGQRGYHLPDGEQDDRGPAERYCDDALRITLFEVLRNLAEEFAAHPAYKAKDWAQWPTNRPGQARR